MISQYAPYSKIGIARRVVSDDYLFMDSYYRDRDDYPEAASYAIPFQNMTSVVTQGGMKYYYIKLIELCVPYEGIGAVLPITWINEPYLFVSIWGSTVGTNRTMTTDNPNVADAKFIVPVNDRGNYWDGAAWQQPDWLHLKSDMIIYIPFKVDDSLLNIRITNRFGQIIRTGDVPPAAIDESLQTYCLFKLSETYEQLARAGE